MAEMASKVDIRWQYQPWCFTYNISQLSMTWWSSSSLTRRWTTKGWLTPVERKDPSVRFSLHGSIYLAACVPGARREQSLRARSYLCKRTRPARPKGAHDQDGTVFGHYIWANMLLKPKIVVSFDIYSALPTVILLFNVENLPDV